MVARRRGRRAGGRGGALTRRRLCVRTQVPALRVADCTLQGARARAPRAPRDSPHAAASQGCGEQLGWRFSLPPDAAARRAAPATSPRVPPASPFPRRGGGAGPKGAGEEGEEEEDEEDEEDEEGEGDPADTRALPSAFFALILDRVVFQRAARQLLDLFLAV
jgi:hypothetical protein